MRTEECNKRVLSVALIATVALIVMAGMLGAAYNKNAKQEVAINSLLNPKLLKCYSTDVVNVRFAPSKDALRVLQLRPYQPVQVVKRINDWTLVQLSGEVRAYVYAPLLRQPKGGECLDPEKK